MLRAFMDCNDPDYRDFCTVEWSTRFTARKYRDILYHLTDVCYYHHTDVYCDIEYNNIPCISIVLLYDEGYNPISDTTITVMMKKPNNDYKIVRVMSLDFLKEGLEYKGV